MAASQDNQPDDADSLLRAYESQLHGALVFGANSLPDVQEFLRERQLRLALDDPRLMPLLRAWLTQRIGSGGRASTESVVDAIKADFPGLPPGVIGELTALEYQLRLRQGQFVDASTILNSVQSSDACHETHEQTANASGQQPPGSLPAGKPVEPKQSFQLAPGTAVGAFRIVKGISRGGMGEVYLAEQVHPVTRKVALKIIRQRVGDSPQHRLRFEAECQAQALMDHPHIARIYEAGTTEHGQPYVAMEYVAGQSIATYCDAHRLTIRERLALFLQTCRAVQHAHQRGIIHRDITPNNVLVSDSTSGPAARVIDFGLAKALQPEVRLTEEEMYSAVDRPIGTFLFMSPEQTGTDSLGADVRTDVYSLGALLYLLLTGTPPIHDPDFGRKSHYEKCALICQQEAPRPSQRVRTLEDSFADARGTTKRSLVKVLEGDPDWIVLKALEKDRERRYPSVSEFADDIERYLSDRPVAARRPTLAYRLTKFVRRNLAATVVGATVVVAAAVLPTQEVRRREDQRQAQIASLNADLRQKEADAAKRDALLQKLLIAADRTTSDRRRLEALDTGIQNTLLTDADRVDLQLAKAEVLHRLQDGAGLRELVNGILPLNDQQRGQLKLWKVRKVYLPDQERQLASDLLKEAERYRLDPADVAYLQSLLSPGRSEAITQLQSAICEYPQHEFLRKFLITLLLIEGRTNELQQQISESRLLWPGAVYTELAEGLSMAFSGDREGVEQCLQRLRSLPHLKPADLQMFEDLFHVITSLSTMVLEFNPDAPERPDESSLSMILKLGQSLTASDELPAIWQESFGRDLQFGVEPGLVQRIRDFETRFASRLSLATASSVLLGNKPFLTLYRELEAATPIPGDAMFVRIRAYVHLKSENFGEAAKELEQALKSPCVFTRLQTRMLYEAALCHMGIFFASMKTDQAALQRAGELALLWTQRSDDRELVYVQRIQNVLRLSGQYDEALKLIREFQKIQPVRDRDLLIPSELQILWDAGRHPELLTLTDQLLSESASTSPELRTAALDFRGKATESLNKLMEKYPAPMPATP